MGTNDKRTEHEFSYCGEHDNKAPASADVNPPSPSSSLARMIALGVLAGISGRYWATPHFRKRMSERGFDVLDVEYVIRNGDCLREGEFIAEYRHHKYTFRGNLDGTDFDAAFALSADHDLIEAPLLILVSGCFKTRSGKRKNSF
jgi:Domain of unknown function (DUF4258)